MTEQTEPSEIVILFHSGHGHTRVLAHAVARGAASVRGAVATSIEVAEAAERWAEIDRADALVLGCPTYMGSVSGPFKSFMDLTSSRWAEQRWRDKIAAGFTNSAGLNGDKLHTLMSLTLFAMQHGMIWVGLGLLPGQHTSQSSPEELNRLASFLGAMGQSPSDLGPELAPPHSDRRTAEHLGRRVARAALALRGRDLAPREERSACRT